MTTVDPANLAIAADALKQMAELVLDRDADAPEHIAMKSVGEIVAEYDNMLTTNARRGFRNQTDERELAAAHRDIIKALAPQAYYEGLRQGGVEQADADEEDAQNIADWIASQLPHVRGFAESIMDAKRDKLSQEAVYLRLDAWLRALQSLGDLGYAVAQKNKVGTWRLGATEEHCNTCDQLNGRRHRLSWWIKYDFIPRQPGSKTLDCGGWNCDCKIVDDKGKQLLPA